MPNLRPMWLCTTSLAVACSSAHRAGQVAAVRPPSGPPVYPLTGLPATDAARQHRPALSVKIDNVGEARPQAGLNSVDLVTDILVEGGLTRLMATFQSQDIGAIGPIRSARPVDADLLRELGGGIFAYSGAAPGEIAPSRQHSTALLVSNDADPRWFHRAGGHAARTTSTPRPAGCSRPAGRCARACRPDRSCSATHPLHPRGRLYAPSV